MHKKVFLINAPASENQFDDSTWRDYKSTV